MAFHRDELSVPQELQVAAEIALGHRCLSLVRSSEEIGQSQLSLNHLAELEAIATEAKHLRCCLNSPEVKQTLEQIIVQSLWQLLHDVPATFEADIHRLERLIDVGQQLNLGLSLHRAQELYFTCLHQSVPQRLQALKTEDYWNKAQMHQLLKLGQKLAVDVSGLLNQVP